MKTLERDRQRATSRAMVAKTMAVLVAHLALSAVRAGSHHSRRSQPGRCCVASIRRKCSIQEPVRIWDSCSSLG
jgi:hypothetical protein